MSLEKRVDNLLMDLFNNLTKAVEEPSVNAMPLEDGEKVEECAICGKKQRSILEGLPDSNKQWVCSFKCFHASEEKLREKEDKESNKQQ